MFDSFIGLFAKDKSSQKDLINSYLKARTKQIPNFSCSLNSSSENAAKFLQLFDEQLCLAEMAIIEINSLVLDQEKEQSADDAVKSMKFTIEKQEELIKEKNDEIIKLKKREEELISKLEALTKQKELSENLISKGLVSNSNVEEILDKATREINNIQNDILNFLISIPNISDSVGSLLEKCLCISICTYFTQFQQNNSSTLDVAQQKLKSLIINNNLHNTVAEESLNNLLNFMNSITERIHKIELSSSIRLEWFESSNTHNHIVDGSVSIGSGSEIERVEYVCLFPSLIFGESIQLKGRVLEVKYLK